MVSTRRSVNCLVEQAHGMHSRGVARWALVFSGALLALLFLAVWRGAPTNNAVAGPRPLQGGGPPILTESDAPECDAANDGPYPPNGPTNTCAGARPPGSDYDTNISGGN